MPRFVWNVTALLAALLVACGGGGAGAGSDGGADAGAVEGERQPVVRFDGYVYVEPDATDFVITERIKQQVLTVFPGLRRSRVMVSRREVPGARADAFLREVVAVVDPSSDALAPMLRVRYRYLSRADVSRGVDGRQEVPLAVLHRTRGVDARRIVAECTARAGDRGAEATVSLDFDPTLEGCKAAIQAEQAAIDAARAKLPPPPAGIEIIPVEELERLYIPVAVSLEVPPADAPRGGYPRYESLRPPPVASASAAAAPPEPEIDPTIKPAEVIIDPDLTYGNAGEAKGAAQGAAQGQPAAGAGAAEAKPGDPREPVIAPPAAPAAPQPPKAEEGLAERFESVFDQLFQMKFIAVWASLLLVIPVLLGESRRRKKPD